MSYSANTTFRLRDLPLRGTDDQESDLPFNMRSKSPRTERKERRDRFVATRDMWNAFRLFGFSVQEGVTWDLDVVKGEMRVRFTNPRLIGVHPRTLEPNEHYTGTWLFQVSSYGDLVAEVLSNRNFMDAIADRGKTKLKYKRYPN